MKEERKRVTNIFEEDAQSIWYTIDLVDTIIDDDGNVVGGYDVPLYIDVECMKEYDRYTGTLIDTSPIYAQVTDGGGYPLYYIDDVYGNLDLIAECEQWIRENEYEYDTK
jgi:hypothetical protein